MLMSGCLSTLIIDMSLIYCDLLNSLLVSLFMLFKWVKKSLLYLSVLLISLGAGMMCPIPGILINHLGYFHNIFFWQISFSCAPFMSCPSASLERDDETGLWQVDIDMIDVLFTSLVEYLQLEDVYNIFILNPKRDAKRTKYGYR